MNVEFHIYSNALFVTIPLLLFIIESCPASTDSVSAVYRDPKKIENERNKLFVSLKTPAKRERAVVWWNTAAQTRPVLDSSSFSPVLTIPRRTCLHSASSVLAVRISCCDIAVFVVRKPLFIN
jgi:hypothetical protein